MTNALTQAQLAQQTNRTSDGRYTTKNHSEAEVGLGLAQQHSDQVQHLIGQAYEDRHAIRSEVLDELASTSGLHVVSAVRHESTDPDGAGERATVAQIVENHPQLPRTLGKAATDAYSNTQDYHYGVGASQADELRSTQLVVPVDADGQPIIDPIQRDQTASWQVVHAYGAHSDTEAEDRHEVLASFETRQLAQQFASTDTAGAHESGSLGYYNADGSYDSDATFWQPYEQSHRLTDRGLLHDMTGTTIPMK